MATLVIRNVEDSLRDRLKQHAAAHGRSMEEDVRMILRECLAATAPDPATHWVDAIRALFEPIGGLDLPEIGREPVGEPAVFQEQKRPR